MLPNPFFVRVSSNALAVPSKVMPESLDIVRRIDEDPVFGTPVLAPPSDRTDLSDWVNSVAMVIRRLTYPRNAATPLPEFQVSPGFSL